MDRELLCSWLRLPPEPWPPDHFRLLDLDRAATAEQIEQRVMERMDLLRRYQLLHPEQATEGMNLLAQAMITLTDPAARAAYNRGDAKAPEPPVFIEFNDTLLEPEPPEPLPLPEEDTGPAVYTLAEERRPSAVAIKPRGTARPKRPRPKSTPATPRPETRRLLYRDLVRIRRVMRPWARLRGHLDSPEKAFAKRTDITDFMGCLAELRPLLPTVTDLVGSSQQPGHLIATMARQPLAVDVFRSLLPSQKESLSKDCRLAHVALRTAYEERRATVRQLTAKGFARRVANPLVREVIMRPEWVILAIGVLALAIAFVRSVPS